MKPSSSHDLGKRKVLQPWNEKVHPPPSSIPQPIQVAVIIQHRQKQQKASLNKNKKHTNRPVYSLYKGFIELLAPGG